eukprot:scaffold87_cov167-Isochrysis_galbana.AAC.1
MSISAYASDLSAASPSHSCEFTQSNPSPSSGMVQPVVNEMFATVHAAGSSLLGLFTSCATFDSTKRKRAYTSQAQKVTRQGRHKGAGKGTTSTSLTKWICRRVPCRKACSEGGGLSRGGLPTPLSGA